MARATIVQANDIVLKYTLTDQDGTAVNLTSATIKWSIRKSLDDAAALTKTTADNIAITNASGGIFEVTLTDTEQADLLGEYIMEAVITDSSGKVYTVTDDQIEPDRLTYRAIYTEA